MYFLLSGEGPTDMGTGTIADAVNEGAHFQPGPMAHFVDRIVANRWTYSILETDGAVGFVSESLLTEKASELKAAKKSLRLPGTRQAKETRYFFNNARVLARIAKERETECGLVAAVLFRDSDGKASAGRGLWEHKRQSMADGFAEEGFNRGVPMLPKPKSEAWLLCALRLPPYADCEELENRPGNDASPKSLKKELGAVLGAQPTRVGLSQLCRVGGIDPVRIRMPSFEAFRNRLEQVVGDAARLIEEL